jgi:hypothetical protein
MVMPDMTAVKRTIETYAEFTGSEGDKIKLTITDTTISVRVNMRGAEEQRLSICHTDFAVIVGEVEARKRAIYAAGDTSVVPTKRSAILERGEAVPMQVRVRAP